MLHYERLEEGSRDEDEKVVSITENQFKFMLGRSIIEAIHVVMRVMERHRERNMYLHIYSVH